MKIFLVVEGNSDKILFDGQRDWFNSLGFEVNIIQTNGKKNMIKTAKKHYRIAILQGASNTIFLPDQNGDVCAMVARQKLGMDAQDRAVTIVMKRELEAWILADGQCIRDSISVSYSPAGQTDVETDPKQKLRSLLKHTLGYFPTEVEASTIVAPLFSINRAAMNNTSAKRFKEFIEAISESRSNAT